MEILTDLEFQFHKTAVCIGKFDGIHIGHRALLREAGKSGLTLVMITFIFPDNKAIYSYEEKKYLVEKLGIDKLVAIPVTESFMRMPAEEFITEILVRRCDARHIAVGSDFRFGYRRQGSAEMLKKAGETYGFDVCIMEKLKQDGKVISSTRIRSFLKKGEIEAANELLQTPYFIGGKVEPGNKIGRRMSVPTANIRPSGQKELPPFGVYTVRVLVDGKWYDGVSNLGVKPTIPGENPVGLEVWLFDYEGDLYNRELFVFFYVFQRPERKFENMAALKQQITSDTRQAEENLARIPPGSI